jgi:flagella basal body P-ring formation protein FlgA
MKKERSTLVNPQARKKSRRRIKVLLLTILLAGTALPCHAFDITFRPSADVSGKSITLGDLADLDSHSELAKALAGQTVAASPDPGQKIDIDSSSIIQKLSRTITTPADIKWLGARTVTVTRQGVTISTQVVQNIIKDYIDGQAGKLPDGKYTFTPKDPPLPFMVPVGDLEWEVTPSNPGIIGSSRLVLIGRIDNQVVKNFSVRGSLEALVPVAVAVSSLRRNDLITEADIRMEPRDISSLRSPCLHLEQVIGKKVLRNTQAGSVIDLASIEIPPMVKKGALVKILGQKNGMELTATGISLTDGQEEQVIKVKNTSSNKDIFCRVIGPGLVEVQL